jgi:hypothetical protein
MFEELQKKKFLLCKGFIKPEFAAKLGSEFISYCKAEPDKVLRDTSYYQHNYTTYMELLVEKNRNVSHFLKRNMLPTYTVARLFNTNDFQKVATDGPSSEVGVLICLFQDSAWNLFFQTQEGYTQDYNLGFGDAMIYLASEVKHWKPRYAGENAVYITNYYVRSRGPNSKYAFNNNLP